MTERLYYTDPTIREFDATVMHVEVADGRQIVRLDRTAFYPTSGGQPFDVGTLGGARVVEVLDVSPDAMIAHGVALDRVRAIRDDGDHFCFIDPDICARGPFLGPFLAIVEPLAGAALVLGLLTRDAGLVVAVDMMIVHAGLVGLADPGSTRWLELVVLLTLLATPLLYSIFDDVQEFFRRRRVRNEDEVEVTDAATA